MAQWLRELAVLPEIFSVAPSTYIESNWQLSVIPLGGIQ